MEIMGKDAVLEALQGITGWEYQEHAISKTFRPGSFRSGVALLNRIADAAEQQLHHPHLALSSAGEVTATLSTHSAGGVTRADIKLASTIESQALQS